MYLVKFIPGFESVAEGELARLPVRLVSVESDIALFEAKKQVDLPWANHIYRVLGSYPARSVPELMRAVMQDGRWAAVLRGMAQGETFRIQCMNRDQLISADAQALRRIEQIAYGAGLSVHRTAPRHELRLWLRDGGRGLFLLCMDGRASWEKTLPPGALRPDLCHLLCRFARVRRDERCCDPFCGYGSIPRAMLYYRPAVIVATDADAEAIRPLRGVKGIQANVRDALAAPPTERFDVIITDPPWGRYQRALGKETLKSLFFLFAEQLTEAGRLVLFLDRRMDVEETARECGLALDAGIEAVYSGNKVKALRFVRADSILD